MAQPIAGDHADVTRDLPALSLRAAFRPGSVDPAKRTVELVWSTGARVLRGFWDQFWEELSLDPSHVRMQRLNNGAPLLDTHDLYAGAAGQLGVVESARLEKGQGVAVVRFCKPEDDPEADKVFRKVADGIVQNVSVGYRVFKFEKVEGGEGQIPVYRAVDWEPYEISVVPAGADDGAGVRSINPNSPNPCVFVAPRRQERTMEPTSTQTSATQTAAASTTAASEEATRAAAAAAAEAATTAEIERGVAIRALVAKHKLPTELAERLVKERKSIDQARAIVLDELATASDATRSQPHHPVTGGTDLRREAVRSGMTNAILHRVSPGVVKLEDVGREFASMRLLRMAEEALESHGVKTRGWSPMELAGAALGLEVRGQHSTSDFPLILADVSNKTLRRAYDEAPQTFTAIARRTSLPDFKPVKRNQLGEAPELKKVNEGGEFTKGTIGEGKEQYQLATYGRVFAITRQAIVNDDMDAFSRIPALFGRSARDLESDLVWAQITANAAMSDGTALFHADHGNLAGSGAAIAIDTLGAGRAAMRKQKGIGAKQFINVQARSLVVPAAKETIAEQFVSSNLVASASGSVNPFAGKFQVVAEPRLDANSLTAWYLAADPAAIDMIEYAYLDGENGPVIETRIGFEVDGMEIKCRHDFAAKVIDHRGFYKNPGA